MVMPRISRVRGQIIGMGMDDEPVDGSMFMDKQTIISEQRPHQGEVENGKSDA